jgi:3-methyladenine DNA glycosylase AlkC
MWIDDNIWINTFVRNRHGFQVLNMLNKKYSQTCLNQTLKKSETCLNQTLKKSESCINLSKPNSKEIRILDKPV